MHRFRGKTFRFTFEDGEMANKTWEHTFADDGHLSYKLAGGEGEATRAEATAIAQMRDDVFVVSYLGMGGYTLTTVLDFSTNRLVAFASNEKELTVHHGSFEAAQGLYGVEEMPVAGVH
jgi:hypothetical protein